MRRALEREPLAYAVERRTGSHVRLVSERGFGPLTWAFHDGQTLPPFLVKKILTRDVGLTEEEALSIL